MTENNQDVVGLSIQKLLSTMEGRTVLCEILDCCYLFDFAELGTEAMIHRAGKQAVGSDILNMILDADPEGYIRLQKHRINEDLALKGAKDVD